MRWILRGLLAVACLAVVAVLGLVGLDLATQPPKPDTEALIARAEAYDVRVRRDEWGVPHILGVRDADAAFGLAYAQAEDDFATIQSVVLATRGTLARTAGPKAAVTDYLVGLLDVWPTVEAGYPRLPADLRALLEAYADGVNLYAAQHPKAVTPGLLPLTGKDVLAGFVFKQPFFYGLDGELKHLNAPEEAQKEPPKGSNGLAVAPSRTADGVTHLLVNSHQPYTGPVAWYEAVVESGEGWHVAGGFFPGAPFMLHGHNEHLGWANTVSKPDLFDAYRLVINPKNKNQYRLDGRWRDFQRHDVKMRVKLWGPIVIPVTKPALRSVHGPVLETKHGLYALRYAGMGEYRQPLQYWRLNKARTLAEWRAGIAVHALPSLNYIYADGAGNIGFVHNGQYPNRREGVAMNVDWSGVLPGDRGDLIWQGYRPASAIPQLWNPRSGYVYNSNNSPFLASDPADNLKPADFPASQGLQTNVTNRALRVQELVGADRAVTDPAFRRYKFDITYSERSAEVAMVRQVTALDPGGDADLKAAQAILRGWDRRTDVHNRAAALASLMLQPILVAQNNGDPVPAPLDTLKAAIVTLKKGFGRLDPEWGQVNRIRRGQVDLPIDGAADTYRSVWGVPQKDGTLTADAGDTFIMFVDWDKHGVVRSDSIHQFGSATLDAASPHHADQTPLFATMRTKPVLFTEAQLKGHVHEDYRPGKR
ncbi:penicillin amidase [Caulobacter sp. Root655]|uniref:acylase n=1 Tax=Caulobacter sp. Root655 TaxID=1736578 RepID=UPI0006F2E02C|nr:acylase [Caulobacter sp. Root655]KRA66536.1 penicillin amidase [Caulobacter sp. Root655]